MERRGLHGQRITHANLGALSSHTKRRAGLPCPTPRMGAFTACSDAGGWNPHTPLSRSPYRCPVLHRGPRGARTTSVPQERTRAVHSSKHGTRAGAPAPHRSVAEASRQGQVLRRTGNIPLCARDFATGYTTAVGDDIARARGRPRPTPRQCRPRRSRVIYGADMARLDTRTRAAAETGNCWTVPAFLVTVQPGRCGRPPPRTDGTRRVVSAGRIGSCGRSQPGATFQAMTWDTPARARWGAGTAGRAAPHGVRRRTGRSDWAVRPLRRHFNYAPGRMARQLDTPPWSMRAPSSARAVLTTRSCRSSMASPTRTARSSTPLPCRACARMGVW